MSEIKHTPGPWSAEGFEQIAGNGNFYGGLIMGADGETIVAQCVMPNNIPLISAAPELLEALKELENVAESSLDYRPEFRRALSKAHSVIAKATGAA